VYMEEDLDIETTVEVPTDEAAVVPVPDVPATGGHGVAPVIASGGGSEGSDQGQELCINPKNVSFATSRIVLGKIKEIPTVLKLFPSYLAPIAIAYAIQAIDSRSKTARGYTHSFLKGLGPLWSTDEKERFVLRVSERGCRVDFATIMLDLQYTGFDAISTLSNNIDTTVRLLTLRPDMIEEVMQLCCDLGGKSMTDKMECMKGSKFYSDYFELTYIMLVSDGNLKNTVGRISSYFRVERPISHRRNNTHARVLDICQTVSSGITSGLVASKKCQLMAGTDPESREAAMHVTTKLPALHHALAMAWGMAAKSSVPQGEILLDDVPCASKRDCFHTPRFTHVRIKTDAQAQTVIVELKKSTTLYVNTRNLNDPARFIEDPGMISFLPAGSHRAFHIFPYAMNCLSMEVTKQLMSALATKELFVYNRMRHTAAFAKFAIKIDKLTEVEKHPSAQKVKGKLPYKVFFAATGQPNCQATFNDVFREPSDATPTALLHMGSELYAASLLYPAAL
jgi:hypothetical protein